MTCKQIWRKIKPRWFCYYIALGDSISIDLYPMLSLGRRIEDGADGTQIGAASLFYRNRFWREFEGKDLRDSFPDLVFINKTADGATTDSVLRAQLPDLRMVEPGERVLVTLTVGGNDLLQALNRAAMSTRDPAQLRHLLEQELIGIEERLVTVAEQIAQRFPGCVILFTTTYDPTDGSGWLPGASESVGPLPLDVLHRMNDRIRSLAASTPGGVLADVHAHFLGHGLSAPEEERWYWEHSIIEPNARGASEVRRVWWDALLASGHAPEGTAVQSISQA